MPSSHDGVYRGCQVRSVRSAVPHVAKQSTCGVYKVLVFGDMEQGWEWRSLTWTARLPPCRTLAEGLHC